MAQQNSSSSAVAVAAADPLCMRNLSAEPAPAIGSFDTTSGVKLTSHVSPLLMLHLQARVNVPDDRFTWLCDLYKPKSQVPAFLDVCDIAGLVK